MRFAIVLITAFAIATPASAGSKHHGHHVRARPAAHHIYHVPKRRKPKTPAPAPMPAPIPVAAAAIETSTLVFPLVGQSNMVGQGQITAEPLPGVSILTAGGVDPATTDFFGADDSEGGSPGVEFAREMHAAHPDVHVVVVPCAVDGTEIAHWIPGADLYERCVQMTRKALDITGGKIGGVLYWQGESDTKTIALAQNWQTSFTSFAEAFRHAIDAPEAPLMFVVLGTTGYPDKYPGWPTVRDAQATMPLPAHAARVEVLGLAMRDDLHYTAEAQTVIGGRFYAAYAAFSGLPYSAASRNNALQ